MFLEDVFILLKKHDSVHTWNAYTCTICGEKKSVIWLLIQPLVVLMLQMQNCSCGIAPASCTCCWEIKHWSGSIRGQDINKFIQLICAYINKLKSLMQYFAFILKKKDKTNTSSMSSLIIIYSSYYICTHLINNVKILLMHRTVL